MIMPGISRLIVDVIWAIWAACESSPAAAGGGAIIFDCTNVVAPAIRGRIQVIGWFSDAEWTRSWTHRKWESIWPSWK